MGKLYKKTALKRIFFTRTLVRLPFLSLLYLSVLRKEKKGGSPNRIKLVQTQLEERLIDLLSKKDLENEKQ